MNETATITRPAPNPDVQCADCGISGADVMTCEMTLAQCVTGCECVVTTIDSCDWTHGMNACDDHRPSHRGCPECDPRERDDR